MNNQSMNYRVYGALGISAKMANWNADFSGYPKTTSDGTIFGSDKAFKFPMRKMWDQQNETVLNLKSYKVLETEDATTKEIETTLKPRSLEERYEYLFKETIGKKEATAKKGKTAKSDDTGKIRDQRAVCRNLFKAIDVKNFGAAFTVESNNISITGAAQIHQGINKYEGATVEEQQILSPFRNSKDDEADNSTLGTKIVLNEAHYFYPFSINPLAYKENIDLGVTEGYTEEDYLKFKEAALVATTCYSSNSKAGCENEFGLFVKTEKLLGLPSFVDYIEFRKENGKNIISFTNKDLIDRLASKIESIEIYYNPFTTVIENIYNNAKCYNIFTKEEV